MTEDDKLFRRSLGKKINKLRKRRGLTAEKLAELCKMNATYLRQIEGGRGIPSLPLFIKICSILGTSADYLIGPIPEQTESEAVNILFAKLQHLTPEQVNIVIDLTDVLLSHLSKE